MLRRLLLLSALCVCTALFGCAVSRVARYPAARWVHDDDHAPISKPHSREEYSVADGLEYQFFYQIERLVDIPLRGERALHAMGLSTLEEAHNTNNFDEVADSTWFTNRIGKNPIPPEELRTAGLRAQPPDPSGPWKVIRAKTNGVTPGFLIEDARGVKYFLKFDPPDSPELTTAAEVIGTRVMYAVGYNVPQTFIVYFSPAILKIPEKPQDQKTAEKDILNQAKVDAMLEKQPRRPDGTVRAVASCFLTGDLLGPIPALGKRKGDVNDRIPHEHRRELRGYRTFSAFVGNTDVREGNTLDVFLESGPEKKGYVKHYMIDFGNSLGSNTVMPKPKQHYQDYEFNYGEVLGSTVTLGGYRRHWERIQDPGMPSVGLFESKYFKPQTFRPHYPYPPFQYTTDRDGFWATKIVTQLNDAQIAMIVKEAAYSDPRAEAYVTQTLIERRNKIRDHWFSVMNPLDDFQLESAPGGAQIGFKDLAVATGMYPTGAARYQYRVIREQGSEAALPLTEGKDPSIYIPQSVIDGMEAGKPYLVEIRTQAPGEKNFGPSVDLILKKDPKLELIGLKRRYGS